MRLIKSLLIILLLLSQLITAQESKFKINYEKYKLKNGLDVILHEDKSDPIVSVAILYHVGSNREVEGRTGFAHLFEHMLFQESQHVGQDQFFKKIQNAGGTLNGGTWNDGTIYYQIVPKNALEMVLWMESDRMGFLLPTVTQAAFENQQEVVQNEKRQRVDNQPYGHVNYIIDKLLYPADHPYNWQVIGSLEDLRNATIQDIHDFYNKWYGPNNATLVVAGDFENAPTKEWIEKYFGELKEGSPVTPPVARPALLKETKRAFYEDSFAKSPQLNMVFPAVENYHDDSYALQFLSELLSDGKKAPLYQILVEEKKLAPSVSAYFSGLEMAGTFDFVIRAFPQSSLSDVEAAIFEALKRFEEKSFTDEDVERIKAKLETNFYNGLSSILNKSFQLASYNVFNGSPDFLSTDLEKTLAVTKDDILRVYNKYIKDKHYVLTSFVPKGSTNLVAKNSKVFHIEEEDITDKGTLSEKVEIKVDPIPSSFDRNIEPALTEAPVLTLPGVWTKELKNGLKLFGIEHNELPLVTFSITIKGGLYLDEITKVGTANLLAGLLKEGTKNKTPIELEEAINSLGASINVYATDESIVLTANCLASKFDEVFALVEEILLEPRWDEKEFERLKAQSLESLNRRKANPAAIASNVFNKLLYGKSHILAYPVLGTEESVSSINIKDLKNYYNRNFSPVVAHAAITGSITDGKAISAFSAFEKKWKAKEVIFPEYALPNPKEKPELYFVDIPGAKQSEIRIGYLALPYNHSDYYSAVVMNHKLGGSFTSILNLILREEKGYTYGARSGFSGSANPGPFVASAAVQSNATLESAQIFKEELDKYKNGLNDEDLEFTKNALLRSNARRFETLGALMGMLNTMAIYNLPADYVKNEEKIVMDMSHDRIKELAQKYIDIDKMVFLIVGDAATQKERLNELGIGEPVLLNEKGEPVIVQ
jgi:zinc protease